MDETEERSQGYPKREDVGLSTPRGFGQSANRKFGKKLDSVGKMLLLFHLLNRCRWLVVVVSIYSIIINSKTAVEIDFSQILPQRI